jgi:hypothetical protein
MRSHTPLARLLPLERGFEAALQAGLSKTAHADRLAPAPVPSYFKVPRAATKNENKNQSDWARGEKQKFGSIALVAVMERRRPHIVP